MTQGGEVLLQYGALGVLALLALLAVRVVFARLDEATKAERARAERLEAELRTLNDVLRREQAEAIDRVSAAFIEANRSVAEAMRLLKDST